MQFIYNFHFTHEQGPHNQTYTNEIGTQITQFMFLGTFEKFRVLRYVVSRNQLELFLTEFKFFEYFTKKEL